MEKQIKIEEVSVKKQGTNDRTGKDWTLYSVKCSGDQDMTEFSTFNPDYANSEGQQMRGNFEYNEKYKNWQEVSAKQESENTKHSEIMNAIRLVYALVDERLPKIKEDPEQ